MSIDFTRAEGRIERIVEQLVQMITDLKNKQVPLRERVAEAGVAIANVDDAIYDLDLDLED